MNTLTQDPLFKAIREFAERFVRCGRDVYGPEPTPLFATQLNVRTLRIPAGTPEDPGLWPGNAEVAGVQPFCQNLLFDFGLLDVLRGVAAITGEPCFEDARREYLGHFMASCLHPQSGYFPWGEHVGYDMVRGQIHSGDIKGSHEAKVMNVPWADLWAAHPRATRREIEVALYNHVCDETTFQFNRHARMDGRPNLGGGPCSLSSSAGLYIQAWCWLYRMTGESRFLDWARGMNDLFRRQRSPTTGLFPTGEDRPEELWYCEPLDYSLFLLLSAEIAGPEGTDFRTQAMDYLLSYARLAYDPAGPGFFDTLNVVTGQPVIGPSRHYPEIARPRYLKPWQLTGNSCHLGTVATAAGIAYGVTGEAPIRQMFDRALQLMDADGVIARGLTVPSGDMAGLLCGLAYAFNRSGDKGYADTAGRLAEHALAHNRENGLFTSGLPDAGPYYSAREGSADLAAAILAVACSRSGRPELAPPVRNLMGGFRM